MFNPDYTYSAESEVWLPLLRREQFSLTYHQRELTPVLKEGSQTQLLTSRNRLPLGSAAPVLGTYQGVWPGIAADAVFSANTCHIMSWPQVERMFGEIGRLLPVRGVFALYGPFNYGGRHTSESNARFDAMLRERDPCSGLRDIEALLALGEREYLEQEEDIAMPANNRLLVFRRSSD